MAGKGVLAIWHDIAEEAKIDVLHWYNREHHPERVAVPGFLAARRHRARSGKPLLFIIYDVEGVDVLASKKYLDRVNAPTAWTSRSMPHFRNNSRTVCHVVKRLGEGSGAYVATLRISSGTVSQASLSAWVVDLMNEFMARPGSVSCEYWQADAERTTIQTDERRLRGVPDKVDDCVLVITASDADLVETIAEQMSTSLFARGGVAVDRATYQLEFSMASQIMN